MIYLTLFWIGLLFFFAIHILTKIFKWKIEPFLDKYSLLYFIVLSAFAFIAIVTKDPISFGTIIVPTEIQWLITLIATGFGLWKYYLNPLKERVIKIEKEVFVTQADINSMKQDIHFIKETFVTQADMNAVKQDVQFIKEILIANKTKHIG